MPFISNQPEQRRIDRLNRLRSAAAAAAGRNAEELPVMSSPPTVTFGTTATAALSNIVTMLSKPSAFRTSGGFPVENNTLPGAFIFPINKIGNSITPSGNLGTWTGDQEDNQVVFFVDFETDADVFEIKLRNNIGLSNRNYRFIIDGQYYDKIGTDTSGNGSGVNFVKFDFSAQTPARKHRVIRVEGSAGNAHMFYHVAVGPTSSVAHPGSDALDLMALFGGDSMTEAGGVTNFSHYNMWCWRALRRLGIARGYSLAIGSTGYVANSGGARRKFVDQINHDWNRPQLAGADLIVVANGYNDKAGTSSNVATLANVKANALSSWQSIRRLFPDSLIVILGVFAGRSGPDADSIACENGLKAQFDAWSDDFALWIPVSTDVAPWMFGTGYTGATNNSGNSDVVIASDGTHPGDYGHEYIGARFAAAFRQALSKLPG